MKMRRPKMILFDYGHTLANEPCFDGLKGNQALMPYVTRNPRHVTAEEIQAFADRLFCDSCIAKARELGVEIHNSMLDRLTYETLGLEFSLPQPELERVFVDAAVPCAPMPGAQALLDFLKASGIRSGVVSNISFGERTLKGRIDRLLPRNDFEFIIASSEYGVRKPDPLIFELALRKADLPAEDVWFCGDNTICDIYGAAAVGIFPVWFHSPLPCDYRDTSLDVRPDCGHLYIRDWPELIEALKTL